LVAWIRTLVKNVDYPETIHLKDAYAYSTNMETDFMKELRSNGVKMPLQWNSFQLKSSANKYCIVGKQDNKLYKDLKTFVDINVVQKLREYYKFDIQEVNKDTEEELFDYISGPSYQRDGNNDDSLIFAIMPNYENTGGKNFTYKIYLSTGTPDQMPDTKFNPITVKPSDKNFEGYVKNGFATLQYLLGQFTLQQLGHKDVDIELALIEGKTKAYTKDEFMDNIGSSLSLFLLLIFIAPQYRFIGFVTVEKSSRAREGMKIMGLTDAPYWLSWFIYYLGVCTTISLICAVIFIAVIFPNSSFLFLFLFVWLYGMSIFSFSMLICSLLQRPRIA